MAMESYSPSHPTDETDNDNETFDWISQDKKNIDTLQHNDVINESISKSPNCDKRTKSSSTDKKRNRSRSKSYSKGSKSHNRSDRERSRSRDKYRKDRSRDNSYRNDDRSRGRNRKRSRGRSKDRSRGRSNERNERSRRDRSDDNRDRSREKLDTSVDKKYSVDQSDKYSTSEAIKLNSPENKEKWSYDSDENEVNNAPVGDSRKNNYNKNESTNSEKDVKDKSGIVVNQSLSKKPVDQFADSDDEFGAWGNEQKTRSNDGVNDLGFEQSENNSNPQDDNDDDFNRGGNRMGRGRGMNNFIPRGGGRMNTNFQPRGNFPNRFPNNSRNNNQQQFGRVNRYGSNTNNNNYQNWSSNNNNREFENSPVEKSTKDTPEYGVWKDVSPKNKVKESAFAEDSDEDFGTWAKEQNNNTNVSDEPTQNQSEIHPQQPNFQPRFQQNRGSFTRGGGNIGTGNFNRNFNRPNFYPHSHPPPPPPQMNDSFKPINQNFMPNVMNPQSTQNRPPPLPPPFNFNPNQMPPWMPPPLPNQMNNFNIIPNLPNPPMSVNIDAVPNQLLPNQMNFQPSMIQQQLLQQRMAAMIPPPPPSTAPTSTATEPSSNSTAMSSIMTSKSMTDSSNLLETLMTKAGLSSDTLRLQQEKQKQQQQEIQQHNQSSNNNLSNLLKSAATTVISRLVENSHKPLRNDINDNMSMSPPSPPVSHSPSPTKHHNAFVPPPLPIYSDVLKPSSNNKHNNLPQPPVSMSANRQFIHDIDENKRMRSEFESKNDWQERIALEVKNHLKPAYMSKKINKTDYKEIMKRAVTKISRSGVNEINSDKIEKFVTSYVEKYYRSRKTKTVVNENDDDIY